MIVKQTFIKYKSLIKILEICLMFCSKISMCQNGPALSRVIAGMWRMAEWNMTAPERLRFIEQCIALGVTTFDHADIYGNGEVESLFGQAIANKPELKNKIEIVTKCGIVLPALNNGAASVKHYNLTPQHITKSVETSLGKLGVDKIDLLLLHRPSPLMDFDEIADTFNTLKASGKVLHFGVSNFSPSQFEALNKYFPLATNQIEFSPINLNAIDDGLFDTLQSYKISPMIWSALGGGRIMSEQSEKMQGIKEAFHTIGNLIGLSTEATIYSWIMQLPCNPAILTGSQNLERIQEAVIGSHMKMDFIHWFELLQKIRGYELA